MNINSRTKKTIIIVEIPEGYELIFKSVRLCKKGVTIPTKEEDFLWVTNKKFKMPTNKKIMEVAKDYAEPKCCGVWQVPNSIIKDWARKDFLEGTKWFRSQILGGVE